MSTEQPPQPQTQTIELSEDDIDKIIPALIREAEVWQEYPDRDEMIDEQLAEYRDLIDRLRKLDREWCLIVSAATMIKHPIEL